MLVSLSPAAPLTLTTDHQWREYQDHRVLAITWQDTRWPGVHIAEPMRDWQGYGHYVMDVFNKEGVVQPITVAVRHQGKEGTARYYRVPLEPGPNRVRIDLQHLAKTDVDAWAAITHLIIHTGQSYAGQRILLGRVWLER